MQKNFSNQKCKKLQIKTNENQKDTAINCIQLLSEGCDIKNGNPK
jgi:hypothetical protein